MVTQSSIDLNSPWATQKYEVVSKLFFCGFPLVFKLSQKNIPPIFFLNFTFSSQPSITSFRMRTNFFLIWANGSEFVQDVMEESKFSFAFCQYTREKFQLSKLAC